MYVDELFFITIPAILIAIVFVLYLATFVPIFRKTRLQMIQNNDQSAHQRADF